MRQRRAAAGIRPARGGRGKPAENRVAPVVHEAPSSPAAVRVAAAVPGGAEASAPVIRIRGARTHNLRNVDVDLPRNRLVVVTGPSGSGKSSLAFDTLFAEGQRRYVESLGAAARQFIDQLPTPDVDLIEGLTPAVALEQDSRRSSPRSTVGTSTEIYDHFRLLFARIGRVHHPTTGIELRRHTREEMVAEVLALPVGTRFAVLAPVVRKQPGAHRELLEDLRKRGFVRVAIDEVVHDLGDEVALDPSRRHTIEVYVDRLQLKDGIESRLHDSIELASQLGEGWVKILTLEGRELSFCERHADESGEVVLPELTPSLFSFNSREGACPRCEGLGYVRHYDVELLVPDPRRSLKDGAIAPWSNGAGAISGVHHRRLTAIVEHMGASLDTPWRALSEEVKTVLLYGSGNERIPALGDRPFEGVVPSLERRERDGEARAEAEDDLDGPEDPAEFAREVRCPACDGSRLRPEALMVRIAGLHVHDVASMPVTRLRPWVDGLSFSPAEQVVADTVLDRVRKRLRFLEDIGLGYLDLDRPCRTLSGGEHQRVRLATQLGAALVGITYVLDEPSIGLHPRDTRKLLQALTRLRDLGNTLIVVEHDEATIREADWVVDMGPGAGVHGGTIVAAGTVADLIAEPRSPTGAHLSGRLVEPGVRRRRVSKGQSITVRGARGHNLQDVTARIPVGLFTCVTGVSGSGKSSLVIDTLLPEAARVLSGSAARGLPHEAIDGLQHLDKVIHVDQSPIGRSPRSNPATFTGIFGELRQIFAQLPDARIRGYSPARFSFNVRGGRCETCEGEGLRRIEMQFLPDVRVVCDACKGRRYARETLSVTLRGKSIADVLDLSVADAYDFFVAHPAIRAKLETMRDIGLGYVTLGQSAPTLSGGEAQRLKLSRELSRKSTGRTLFVLDEPTTGLHFSDIKHLLRAIDRLVDEGNTVIVIEHNLDVIRSADHVIDMGPEGGSGGGRIVTVGTPEQIAESPASHTGRHLRD